MADTRDLDIIEAMSRRDFFDKIVCDIGARKDFSRAATFGVESLDTVQKDMLARSLNECGIPRELTDTDEKFNNIIRQITSRSVALRWIFTCPLSSSWFICNSALGLLIQMASAT